MGIESLIFHSSLKQLFSHIIQIWQFLKHPVTILATGFTKTYIFVTNVVPNIPNDIKPVVLFNSCVELLFGKTWEVTRKFEVPENEVKIPYPPT